MARERRRAALHDEGGACRTSTEGASVVFIASTTGSVGFPGCSAYTATKGAVDRPRPCARRRARAQRHPRVNTVVPGYVRTPMLQPHLDANEGYEEWIVSQHAAGAHRRAGRARDRTSSSCCPDSRSTFTERRLSSMVAGSPDRPARAGADAQSTPARPARTWRDAARTAPRLRMPRFSAIWVATAVLFARQPAARAGQRQPQRPALDAAVRGDPRDRRDRPDARHPAARPRPVGRRG